MPGRLDNKPHAIGELAENLEGKLKLRAFRRIDLHD
jgi:hypothetical protein